MFLDVLVILVALILALVIYAALKKPAYDIKRSLPIKARPEQLFPYLNNSEKMNQWMPWKDSDPGAIMQYSGPSEGVGSKSFWDSPGKMGKGEAEIIESHPSQSVITKLEYTRPMKMSQIAKMSLTPQGDGQTLMTWSVNGHNSFTFRLFGIFFNVDKMVGGEFEKGLAKLKQMTEV